MRDPDKQEQPLIGVTGPDGWYHIAWRCSRYALGRAGARVVRLTPRRRFPVPVLDGVVVGGGDDIDPALYAGMDDGTGSFDRERDRFEIDILEDALQRKVPVLGICRRAQLMNVVLGGNLHQDVRGMRRHTSNRRTVLARKTVIVQPHSRLHALFGAERFKVNSLHHQAIDRLGEGMRAVAHDLDELVQAVEAVEIAATGFRAGVQWHPEYLPYHKRQRRLFQALVDAAREARAAA